MTDEEAAAHENAMKQASDAERERNEPDWIVSEYGFRYRVVELK